MHNNYNEIPLVDYFNDIARTIVENEDIIYLDSVKYSLAVNRKSNYLFLIDSIAKGLSKEIFFRNLTYKDLLMFIIECSKKSQIDDNENIYSKQGMGWFIGNFVDIIIKSNCFNVEFDKLFKDAFKLHFSLEKNNISDVVLNGSNDFYSFCNKYAENFNN